MKASDEAIGALQLLAEYTRSLGNAITPGNAVPCEDATGTRVGSLTESVMGLTSAMMYIGYAIDRVAEAIESGKDES